LIEPQKIKKSNFIDFILKNKQVVIIDTNCKKWYCGGKLHREDGPAVENSDGSGQCWIDGKFIGLLKSFPIQKK